MGAPVSSHYLSGYSLSLKLWKVAQFSVKGKEELFYHLLQVKGKKQQDSAYPRGILNLIGQTTPFFSFMCRFFKFPEQVLWGMAYRLQFLKCP